jgi:hypothetical protein
VANARWEEGVDVDSILSASKQLPKAEVAAIQTEPIELFFEEMLARYFEDKIDASRKSKLWETILAAKSMLAGAVVATLLTMFILRSFDSKNDSAKLSGPQSAPRTLQRVPGRTSEI